MLDTLNFLLRRLIQKRGAWCYLGNGVGVALTQAGRKIYLPGDDFGMTPEIAMHGHWEPHVERTLRRLLKPGMRVVELGANVGYHTLAMGEAIGPTGHIEAFEPYPKVARLLRQTLLTNRMSDRVTLREMAVLDRPSRVTFAADPLYSGSAHLAIGADPSAYSVSFDVPAVRLDDTLSDEAPIDLLRMDIEGTEGLALRGATAMLARSPKLAIVLEWSPVMLASRGDVGELAQWIAAQGFRAQIIQRSGRLQSVATADLAGLAHCDLVLRR